MRVAIIGGRLQGLEAAYLARAAGFETVVIDRDHIAPAGSIAHEFYHKDIVNDKVGTKEILKGCDFILPASETKKTLICLKGLAEELDIPLALDFQAYCITFSKIASNNLFKEHNIPMPDPWPQCGFPVIVKPSESSGSQGVVKVGSGSELGRILAGLETKPVIQKYSDGPSYSIEVIGHKGKCTSLQVTGLAFDQVYDCKRVIAGPATGNDIEDDLRDISSKISEALNLSGIMDIEVIHTEDGLEVLEIDARMPSQTPTAVYHSTGINILELLVDYYESGLLPNPDILNSRKGGVIYEHYSYNHRKLRTVGENILKGASRLRFYRDIFGADVFISDFEQTPAHWTATAVFIGATETEAWNKRNLAIETIMKSTGGNSFSDPEPV